jgi:hypothetical protein
MTRWDFLNDCYQCSHGKHELGPIRIHIKFNGDGKTTKEKEPGIYIIDFTFKGLLYVKATAID